MSRSKMIIFTAVSAVLVLSFACSGPVLDQESPATQVPKPLITTPTPTAQPPPPHR